MSANESDQENELIIEMRADADQVVIANQVPTVAIPDVRTGSKISYFLRAKKSMLMARNVSKAKRLAPHARILRSHSTLRSISAASTPVAEKETAEYLRKRAVLREQKITNAETATNEMPNDPQKLRPTAPY